MKPSTLTFVRALSSSLHMKDESRRIFRRASFVLTALIFGALFASSVAVADEITIHTGTSPAKDPPIVFGQIDPDFSWNYTGLFSDPRFDAYTYNDPTRPGFGATLDCHMGAVTVGGGDCRQNTIYGPDAVAAGVLPYTGVQFFYASFDLPAGATDVVLTFTRIGGDDRIGVHLNGTGLGYWSGNTSSGTNYMDGGESTQPDVLDVFFNPVCRNCLVVMDQDQFNIGGQNVVRFWVNNTGGAWRGRPTGHTSGNPSALDASFNVEYSIVDPDSDNDGVPDEFDNCLGTEIPEGVPSQMLLVNRWALTDGDGEFNTVAPRRGPGPRPDGYSIEDTTGCSCEQILVALGLEFDRGHTMFGCSISVMDDWIELVTP